MTTVTSHVAGLANRATENASQRTGLFMHILRALHENRAREARRAISKYAHLLPEGMKLTDVSFSVMVGQVHFGDTRD